MKATPTTDIMEPTTELDVQLISNDIYTILAIPGQQYVRGFILPTNHQEPLHIDIPLDDEGVPKINFWLPLYDLTRRNTIMRLDCPNYPGRNKDTFPANYALFYLKQDPTLPLNKTIEYYSPEGCKSPLRGDVVVLKSTRTQTQRYYDIKDYDANLVCSIAGAAATRTMVESKS
ncbi:hypothetical protein BJ138DRAFT_1119427 [Hygrophoropsis aurantiaca]|uniref:Uncharacterized protein n=1 Tax=Hygrophoropsis aurantiaca TaxID=72124 RepID=A0ACB7ZTM0_9AGAM|nr:hypothetical protein BJ138DRAFT_1119427 [Hygrophoropsis aurantiaca]